LFANVAPLRSDSSGAVTFRDLLRRVHSSGLEALAHQMLPFHMIMESLRAAPGAGRVPLGQVMMIHQNAPLPVLHLGAVRFTPVEGVDNGAAKFDYLLDLADTKDGWRGSVKYRADLFDTAGVRRLIAGYQAALEAVTGNPDLPLDQLPVECPAVAAVVAEARREFVAPRDEAERQMAQLWAEVFRLPAVGVHDNFFELGGTSLLAAQLLERVRAATGKRLRLTTLFELPTVAQVTAALRTGAAGRGSTLVALKPAGALPPLFCFPGAAGNAMAFRELWSLLNPDQPVYATTEEKDLEGNPAAFAVLESLAADYLKDVRAMQPQGPYYFAGLCFGGLLAYEMACQLESQGERMACLLLLDPPPPGTARSLPGSAFRQGAAVFLKGLKQLPPRERIPRLLRVGTNIALQILDRWRISAEGLLLKLDPQGKVTRRLLDRRRTNVQAAAKYVPKPYHGALHLFMAAENGFTMNKVMEESWRKLGGGGFAAEILPGNHNSFFKAPHVQTLADRMNALLRQALQQAA
jgi:thioesterase domain-containing protein